MNQIKAKNDWLIAGIILAIGCFYILTFRRGYLWADDTFLYLHHAKNIVLGKSYKDVGYIHNPFYPYPYLGPPSGTCPPLFPFLLAPLYKFFGLNFWMMKMEMVAFFLASLFLIYRYFKNEIPARYLAVMIAVLGLNPYFWEFTDYILSDIPFLFFVFLNLNLIKKIHHDSYPPRNRIVPRAILVGICLYLAYGTRSLGIFLFLSFVIADFLRWGKPTRFVILTGLVFLSAATLQSLLVHHDAGYIAGYTMPSFRKIPHLIALHIEILSDFWKDGHRYKFFQTLSIAVNTLVFFGWISRAKRSLTMTEIFPLLYGAFLVLWPTDAGIRYWIPIIPLYIFYFFVGAERISGYAGKRWRTISFIILSLSILVSYFNRFTKLGFRHFNDVMVTSEESGRLFAYVRRETEGDAIFLFLKPRTLSFFTERKAAGYHPHQGEQGLWCFFREIGATHLIISPFDFSFYGDFSMKFIRKYRANFKESYSSENYKVYKIVSFPSDIVCRSP